MSFDDNNFYNNGNFFNNSDKNDQTFDSYVEEVKENSDNNDLEQSNIDSDNNNNVAFRPIKIRIIGIGGGGNNAVSRIAEQASLFPTVELYAANTDQQVLKVLEQKYKNINIIPLGGERTRGLGAGSNPEIGKEATLLSKDAIVNVIKGADLVFIAAGMGGGTGTGGAPVIAQICKENGVPCIGIVTYPFNSEGDKKFSQAKKGIDNLREYVDILSIVYNQKALDNYKSIPYNEVVIKADLILLETIKAITDVILNYTTINVDFADLVTVIKDKKTAHIAQGYAKGKNRLARALQMAGENTLLGTSIRNSTNIIVNILYDKRLPAGDVDDALPQIKEVAAKNVNIISGYGLDPKLEDEVYVTIIATGFEDNQLNEENESNNENTNIINNEEVDLNSFLSRLKK